MILPDLSWYLWIIQGFLAKDLQAEALNKLDQRVKGAAEQFMKILEQMDAMVRMSLGSTHYVAYLCAAQ